MDFKDRLQKAIERGQSAQDARSRDAAAQAVTEEEMRRMHGHFRLTLTEHIEGCLRKLPDHFPGFEFETIVGGESGWGAAVSRDDVDFSTTGRSNAFSRLEVTVRSYSEYHVLEVACKGTVKNKEIIRRNHFQRLTEVDIDNFIHMIDMWVLEYAEGYARAQ